jgi:hypothetical protein
LADCRYLIEPDAEMVTMMRYPIGIVANAAGCDEINVTSRRNDGLLINVA